MWCVSGCKRLTNELSSKLKESCQIDTGFIASREHAFLRAMIDLRNPIDMDRYTRLEVVDR